MNLYLGAMEQNRNFMALKCTTEPFESVINPPNFPPLLIKRFHIVSSTEHIKYLSLLSVEDFLDGG